MKIPVKRSFNVLLELLRPAKAPKWRLVLWGDWAEDRYHSGYIAYDIARTGPGQCRRRVNFLVAFIEGAGP